MRDEPEDNGYAKPVEGVIAFVDMARGEVLEVVDHGVDSPSSRKGQLPARGQRPLAPGPPALAVVQSEGPSFTVDGNLIRWQRWSLQGVAGPDGGPRPALGRVGRPWQAKDRSPPGVGHRDGRPLRRAGSDARLEERLRRRRVGSRPDGQLARPRLRLPRRDHVTSTLWAAPRRASPSSSGTPYASTRRTTGSSGSTSTCTPGGPRSAGRGAWS